MKSQNGFSLIELVIFIVVIGILASATALPFISAAKVSPKVNYQLQAIYLAQQRMEAIAGSCHLKGMTSDLCSTSHNLCYRSSGGTYPSICDVPSGFQIEVSINLWAGNPEGPNSPYYRVITVNVSGLAHASLTSLISDYNEPEYT